MLAEEHKFTNQPFFCIEPQLNKLRDEVKANGWWAPFLPESLGGMGFSLTEFACVSEVLGQTPLEHYVFNCQAPDVGNMELLHAFGSDSQKEHFLKPLCEGETRSCFSMTEPEFAGSNPVNMATTAVKEGKEWVISGHKWFTSSTDCSDFAIVMAITSPKAENKYQQASMIAVPTGTPGFEITRNISVMGEVGEGYMSHSEIIYKNCKVCERIYQRYSLWGIDSFGESSGR